MRTKLMYIGGEERHKFYATYSRRGTKTRYGHVVNTVLLIDILDANKHKLCDHLWFNETNGFKKLELKEGDNISFCGRIKQYVKGYLGRRDDVYAPISIDYQITYPTQIKHIDN